MSIILINWNKEDRRNMADSVREVLENMGEFSSQAFDFQGYALYLVSKRQVHKDRFWKNVNCHYEKEVLMELLEDGGMLFALSNSRSIEALYPVKDQGNLLICESKSVSEDLADDPIVDLADQKAAFYLAEIARQRGNCFVEFLGERMPVLLAKRRKINFFSALLGAMIALPICIGTKIDLLPGIGLMAACCVAFGFLMMHRLYVFDKSDKRLAVN